MQAPICPLPIRFGKVPESYQRHTNLQAVSEMCLSLLGIGLSHLYGSGWKDKNLLNPFVLRKGTFINAVRGGGCADQDCLLAGSNINNAVQVGLALETQGLVLWAVGLKVLILALMLLGPVLCPYLGTTAISPYYHLSFLGFCTDPFMFLEFHCCSVVLGD